MMIGRRFNVLYDDHAVVLEQHFGVGRLTGHDIAEDAFVVRFSGARFHVVAR